MRTGTTISAVGHTLVLGWCLLSFSARPYDVKVESVTADVISESEFSRLMAGSKTAPQVAKPQPIVDRIGEPKEPPPKDVTAKPVNKPPVQTADASAPPPPPAKTEPKPEPKPVPKPPEAKPEPKSAEAKPATAFSDVKADSKPEPDPIAEALKREEAKQKEEQKKLEEAKRRDEAKKREEARKEEARKQELKRQEEARKQEEKFDIAKIENALLDKRAPQRQIVTGSMVNPTPALGAPTANAPMLSQNEIDALRAQLMACWNPPVGVAEAKDLIVIVRFELNRDGSVSGEPTVTNRSASSLFQIAAESATRAVRRCQPFRLPASKYEAWRDVEVKFDPNDMFRG